MDKMIFAAIFSTVVFIVILAAIFLPPTQVKQKPDDKSDKIIQATARILDILQLLTLKMKEFEERLDKLSRSE